RPFCATCGTPLGFSFIAAADTIDLTVGSFDEPGYFRPTSHFGVESLHAAWLDTADLPRQRTTDNQPLIDRWVAATGKTPE
ncbi:MAG: GFA family protein, partial [Sphingobium sp.]